MGIFVETGHRRRARPMAGGVAGLCAILLSTAVCASTGNPAVLEPPPPQTLLTFTPTSVEDLVDTLDVVWNRPRAQGTIPNVAPDRFPGGMDELPVPVKKRAFLRALAPHVVAANHWITYEREYLLENLACRCDPEDLSPVQRACLVGLTQRYRVGGKQAPIPFTDEVIEQLRRRVDVVPVGLALAQAAIESGWGASRFARLANNLFGQWVFSAEKGIAPKERPEGADYAIARFEHLGQSVGAYLYNLNTFRAYRNLRELRRTMREDGEELDSHRLAAGLRLYSERRDAYVDDVRLVLRTNRLEAFDGVVFTGTDRPGWESHLAAQGRKAQLQSALLLAPVQDPTQQWSLREEPSEEDDEPGG